VPYLNRRRPIESLVLTIYEGAPCGGAGINYAATCMRKLGSTRPCQRKCRAHLGEGVHVSPSAASRARKHIYKRGHPRAIMITAVAGFSSAQLRRSSNATVIRKRINIGASPLGEGAPAPPARAPRRLTYPHTCACRRGAFSTNIHENISISLGSAVHAYNALE